MISITILFNFFSTSFMTGLIWLIQCVHYPSFYFVKEREFISFCSFHNRSITFIVLPMMLIELITSLYLWWSLREQLLLVALALNFLLIVTTFFMSVPCHHRLGRGKSDEWIKKLVQTNWWRTLLWTARSLIMGWYLGHKIA